MSKALFLFEINETLEKFLSFVLFALANLKLIC